MSFGPDPRGALTAVNRFGYGARGGDSDDLASAAADPRGFVLSELARPDAALLAGPDLADSPRLIQEMFAFFAEQRAKRLQKPAPEVMGMESQSAMAPRRPGEPRRAPRPPNVIQQAYLRDASARFGRACTAEVGFVERLVAFWSNFFTVSAAKGPLVRICAGAFEREAIRPHVLGRFADMLKAVERHPAMLVYLDNQFSFGPDSPAGRRTGRGLNENLARETMELHSIGVDGGYTQADVTNFAKILTGWTFARPRSRFARPGTFAFFANAHEPGPQVVMGRTYSERGVEQGLAVLDDLARHSSTPTFVATKLATHFVADAPPPALVERLAETFRKSDGDLRAVSRALVETKEAWDAPLTKMRTPYDFLIAANRAFGRVPERPQPILGPLNMLGMPLWTAPQPNGFPDASQAWASPEGMKLRLDIAARLGSQGGNLPVNPSQLLEQTLGAAASQETRQTVARAESRQQGFALLLMSPEFQRR